MSQSMQMAKTPELPLPKGKEQSHLSRSPDGYRSRAISHNPASKTVKLVLLVVICSTRNLASKHTDNSSGLIFNRFCFLNGIGRMHPILPQLFTLHPATSLGSGNLLSFNQSSLTSLQLASYGIRQKRKLCNVKSLLAIENNSLHFCFIKCCCINILNQLRVPQLDRNNCAAL